LTAIIFLVGLLFIRTNTPLKETPYNIRLAVALEGYSVPVPGIKFIISKYESAGYQNPLGESHMPPTINKYLDLVVEGGDKKTTAKSVTPIIYRATEGYYEITAEQDDNYSSIAPFRFYISPDGNFQLTGNNPGVSYNAGYELNAKEFNQEGEETNNIKDEKTNVIEFHIQPNNYILLKNVASDYSHALSPPDGYDYSSSGSQFIASYFEASNKNWVPLKNPDGTVKKFNVELQKYGGGKRLDDGVYKDYEYYFSEGIPIIPNKKYKVEQSSNPVGYNNTYNGSEPILFKFTFSTSSTCSVLFPVMESKTYAFFVQKYHGLFDIGGNSLFTGTPTEGEKAFNKSLSENINYTVLYTIGIKEQTAVVSP
ncbi:MAG: hypothetical protein LBV08_01455, partial [Clostridiales bacterium]|nr:hypothetical protein [Clostridiales bacterium]